MTEELDSVERRAWSAVVTLAMRVPSALDSRLQREFGVTHFEYRVMALLREAPDHRMQLGLLAARGHGSISRLSHVVSKLERVGWAKRAAAESGRGGGRGTHRERAGQGGRGDAGVPGRGAQAGTRRARRPQKAELAALGERLSDHLLRHPR